VTEMSSLARRRWVTRVSSLPLAALFVAACGVVDPNDPSREAFDPHPMFRLEPRPNLPAMASFGPHDSFGLRGRGLDPGAKIRVLTLGGASVYGVGAPAEQTIPGRLSSSLAKLEPSSSVANGGCPGHCAAAAELRLHLRLGSLKPTHVVYVLSWEDMQVYAAEAFQSDLGHVPRPWTGKPWPATQPSLSPSGAEALRRDLRGIAVLARIQGAKTIFAAPHGPSFEPLRAAARHEAVTSQGTWFELPGEGEAPFQKLALEVIRVR